MNNSLDTKDAILKKGSLLELLDLYSRLLDELWERQVVRTVNNPVADYAEYLICKALSLEPAGKSEKGYDACDKDRRKYEVKARRHSKRSKPKRFSAIRDLKAKHFDYLIAVLFLENFHVERAVILTHEAVVEKAFYQKHVNGWILPINDNLWSGKGVADITQMLKETQLEVV